jgi:hypothetical protein
MKSLFLFVALAAVIPVCAQSTDKKTAMKSHVESKSFVFRAQMALPQTGMGDHDQAERHHGGCQADVADHYVERLCNIAGDLQ